MEHNNYKKMFIVMIISGLLSTMNIWTNKFDDINISLNDIYMSFLMTGWMFLLMGILEKNKKIFLFGISLVILNIIAIRNQFMISQNEFLRGMIPHHSMAIHMSKKLLEKQNNISHFLKNIINIQEKEIIFMKNKLYKNMQDEKA